MHLKSLFSLVVPEQKRCYVYISGFSQPFVSRIVQDIFLGSQFNFSFGLNFPRSALMKLSKENVSKFQDFPGPRRLCSFKYNAHCHTEGVR